MRNSANRAVHFVAAGCQYDGEVGFDRVAQEDRAVGQRDERIEQAAQGVGQARAHRSLERLFLVAEQRALERQRQRVGQAVEQARGKDRKGTDCAQDGLGRPVQGAGKAGGEGAHEAAGGLDKTAQRAADKTQRARNQAADERPVHQVFKVEPRGPAVEVHAVFHQQAAHHRKVDNRRDAQRLGRAQQVFAGKVGNGVRHALAAEEARRALRRLPQENGGEQAQHGQRRRRDGQYRLAKRGGVAFAQAVVLGLARALQVLLPEDTTRHWHE